MKEFHPDPAALRVLQIAVCLPAAGLIAAAALFLSRWQLLMWIVIAVLAAAAVILSLFLLPHFFRRLQCTVTSSQITVCAGIILKREQSIRLERVQFVQMLSGPFDGALGLNFATLYVYGGQLTVAFLSRSDCNALSAMLRQKGVFYAP